MPLPAWVPIREDLRGFEPYGAPQIPDVINLNVNENPYGPSAETAADIAESVRAAATTLNRYPDREALALRAGLADYLGHGLTVDRVWAANGSNEIMLQILQAFGGPGRTALSFAPTYSMYPEYARDTHTRWVTGQREQDFTVDVDRRAGADRGRAARCRAADVAQQPDRDGAAAGHRASRRRGGAGRRGGRRGLCGVPPAGHAERPRRAEEFPRLLVTRTMSKAFALAGGRLGYVAADAAIIDALRIVRLPYHLSAVTQAAAGAALRHRDELLARVDELRATRDELAAWLTAHDFEVADSDANFVLFGRFDDRHAIWQGLVDRGVLIRETGPDGWLRVSVGTPDEMQAFYTSLLEVTR